MEGKFTNLVTPKDRFAISKCKDVRECRVLEFFVWKHTNKVCARTPIKVKYRCVKIFNFLARILVFEYS